MSSISDDFSGSDLPNNAFVGRAFYQSEPLIARLRGIMRDYPEGVGILKELIQNADDAQATEVEITIDWRTHSLEKLPSAGMENLTGPAMLVYNNQVFTDRDFDSIRSLGQSEKAQDLQKTGRFGVGFNAVYHVTDYPSFISRDRLVFFDPHGSAVPGTSRQEPGREWNLAAWQTEYPEFISLYGAGCRSSSLLSTTTNFTGTLFRLPLRTPTQAESSEIRKQPFTESNIRELLDNLISSGEELLIFLKSVQSIRVYEIPAQSQSNDQVKNQTIRQEILAITTKNTSEVSQSRQKLVRAIPASPTALLEQCRQRQGTLEQVSFQHQIEMIVGDRTIQSLWRIVNLIRIDNGQELAEVITTMHESQEKVVPWAGAAARIHTSSNNSHPLDGQVYCFLPLPLKTGLPIHIHGFFNLNSSRDNLSSDSGQTGKDRPRAIWNQLLVRHVLAHAYANLIEDLVPDIGSQNPEKLYQLFPLTPITTSGALEDLYKFTLQLLFHKPVIHSGVAREKIKLVQGVEVSTTTQWISPAQTKLLTHTWWQKLNKPLILDKINLPTPEIPSNIINAFAASSVPISAFTPADLRKHLLMNQALGVDLESAPKLSLRKYEWIKDLLSYCLSDIHQNLTGLPLAFLANNKLEVFGYNPAGAIFIGDEISRKIFADYPRWFLHPDLSQLVYNENKKGITQLTPYLVALNLKAILSTEDGEIYYWQEDVYESLELSEESLEEYIDPAWLSLVYEYFTNINQKDFPLEELKAIPLVPSNDGKLYLGGNLSTPFLLSSFLQVSTNKSFVKSTIEAVQYFGIHLVAGTPKLLDKIDRFIRQHPTQLITSLTTAAVVNTIDYLYEQNLPTYNQRYYQSLIKFFAACLAQGETLDESTVNKLTSLPIYLTTSGELVTLEDRGTYLPGNSYEPPAIASDQHLLKIDKKDKELHNFYQYLEVPTLDRSTLIEDYLLEEYSSFASEEQLIALLWIRDNFTAALEELRTIEERQADFTDLIARSKLVRCLDRRLHRFTEIYDPHNQVIRSILGQQAAIPDLDFYSSTSSIESKKSQESKKWLDFFSSLGMQQKPSAEDLLACVEQLIQKSFRYGVSSVEKEAMDLFNYLVDNWEDIKNLKLNHDQQSKSQKLTTILAEKAWLPVERNLEILQQYPGAIVPEERLYKSCDICFSHEANLVSSTKPTLATQFLDFKGFIPTEIRDYLGFYQVALEEVLIHLQVLCQLAEKQRYLPIFFEIYQYLQAEVVTKNYLENTKLTAIKQHFQSLPCLWDGGNQEFWQPIHAFTEPVSYFGKYRGHIPFTHDLGEVYELLGENRSPQIEDYLDFLEDLANIYLDQPLPDEDQSLVIQVCSYLELLLNIANSQGTHDQHEYSNYPVPLLMLSGHLCIAAKAYIPDAPWLNKYIDSKIILHPQINPKLASFLGSKSLLKSIYESPLKVKLADDLETESWCKKWQDTLNSLEFSNAIRRLIFHESELGLSELEITEICSWMKLVKVIPAQNIIVNLVVDSVDLEGGSQEILAQNVPGTHYFDRDKQTCYIVNTKNRYVMLGYLAELINQQLANHRLQNLLPLAYAIDTLPADLPSLCNQMKIRNIDSSILNFSTPSEDTASEIQDVSEATESPPETKASGRSRPYWGSF